MQPNDEGVEDEVVEDDVVEDEGLEDEGLEDEGLAFARWAAALSCLLITHLRHGWRCVSLYSAVLYCPSS